jgi:hypothetical protein
MQTPTLDKEIDMAERIVRTDPAYPDGAERVHVVDNGMAPPAAPAAPVAATPVAPAAPVAATPVAPVAPVATSPVVTRETVEPAVVQSDQVVRRTWASFSLSQVLHGICGAILLILGAIAIARGGFDSPVNDQMSKVAGIPMTTVLGLIVAAAGLLLVIAALTPAGRPFGGFVGVLLILGGIIVVGSNNIQADLHTNSSLGWVGIVLGVVSLLAAFLPEHASARRSYVAVR